MKEMIRTIFVLVVISTSLYVYGQESSIEGGWKKIKVFETKRSEVEKIFGMPGKELNKIYTTYATPEGNVAIIYSNEPCDGTESNKTHYNLEKDTVMDYRVYLKKPIPLSELKWRKGGYRRVADPHRLDIFIYDNRVDGVWVTVGLVDEIEMAGSLWFYSSDQQKCRYRCKK